eukprot:m.201717 g.201717  ORF g.201717 m.201717 type:complete len:68 (-) comp14967_c1_seq1:2055-2258(-)
MTRAIVTHQYLHSNTFLHNVVTNPLTYLRRTKVNGSSSALFYFHVSFQLTTHQCKSHSRLSICVVDT